MIAFPHWDEGGKEGRAMEREGPSQVEVSLAVDVLSQKHWWATTKGRYSLGIRYCGLEPPRWSH